MTRLVRESLWIGASVAATLAALWGSLVWARTAESAQFLDLARNGQGSCFDCPLFLLFSRGFGGGWSLVDLLLTLVSLPAVVMAMRLAPHAMIPELNPIVFFGALLAQSLAIGFVGGAVRWWWRSRRERAGRSGRRTTG